jgi:hypothetical protein
VHYDGGYKPNPEGTAAVVSALKYKRFAQTPAWTADEDDRDAFCWRSVSKLLGQKNLAARNQGSVGSCVGHGTATGCDITTGCEIDWLKQPETFVARASADAMYALGRDLSGDLGRSDGSYGGAAAKAVKHGVLHMLKYGDVDLTSYSGQRCRDWAARGVPDAIKATAKDHPMLYATVVSTPEEARSALQGGYGINVCSGQGFSSSRDKDGFARAQGSWSHSMCIAGYRGGSRRGFLIINSWGPDWVSGPIYPDDMPEGSFWAEWDTIARMLRGEDSFAYSGFQGFVKREMNWDQW